MSRVQEVLVEENDGGTQCDPGAIHVISTGCSITLLA